MAFTHPLLEVIFLLTVVVLWAMIFYQVFFTFLGCLFRHRSMREKAAFDLTGSTSLPPVSILIPSHNEELVIEATLASLMELDYPEDKIEIIVINDGSTDRTAEIVERVASRNPRVSLFNVPPEEAAQGKSNALNLGVRVAKHDMIAIYDADNNPQRDSLRYLMMNFIDRPELAAVFGKFRTINRHRNLLTNFINIETLSFQFLIQAGRYLLFKLAILPGTNFVIRRSILEECGYWDTDALTEDTELSIRIYQKGHEIKFVPYAVTWEQEPELWGTWLRQRTRWVRGNFYVLRKFLLPSFRYGKWALTFELLHLFMLYYAFICSILTSHFFFLFCGLGWLSILSPGPYFSVWVCAFVLFLTEITLALYYEEEASPRNFFVTVLMYFTYTQAWILLVFRALYQEYFLGGKIKWEKTRRFVTAETKESVNTIDE